jgi:DNA-binding NarL/FixJ family response regulator
MKVSLATARRFSESLLQIYAADTGNGVQAALADAEADLGPPETAGWLRELLHGHAAHRQTQLERNATGAPASGIKLTRREQEVLQRIALGETDAAIGQALGIASKTASKHVENILRKLGVETRTAAAASLRSP